MEEFDIAQVVSNYNLITTEFTTDLTEEFRAGRIKGTEYADTYQKLMALAMQEAMTTPLQAAQIRKLDLENEKLELEKELIACKITHCEAQTADILSSTIIKEAQSDKDLLVKTAQIEHYTVQDSLISAQEDNTKNKTVIETAQSAKDLEVKDAQVDKYVADTSVSDANELGIISKTGIQEAQSAKDLLVKDKDIALKEAQASFTIRQTQGFDDSANQKLFDAQMNSWALAFSAGMLSEVPSIIKDNSATELYNCIKKSCP